MLIQFQTPLIFYSTTMLGHTNHVKTPIQVSNIFSKCKQAPIYEGLHNSNNNQGEK